MSNEKFAKVFDSPTKGQILVLKDTDDDDPSIPVLRFVYELPEGRVTQSIYLKGDAFELLDKAFDRCDLETAEDICVTPQVFADIKEEHETP